MQKYTYLMYALLNASLSSLLVLAKLGGMGLIAPPFLTMHTRTVSEGSTRFDLNGEVESTVMLVAYQKRF
jgi:hypothetical protein